MFILFVFYHLWWIKIINKLVLNDMYAIDVMYALEANSQKKFETVYTPSSETEMSWMKIAYQFNLCIQDEQIIRFYYRSIIIR